ncbi:MAG TPA: septation protein spoVG [Acholeplasmataceae bacterium]|nr:septation protein spoVG [Acholeplasmataceae bacterium]
MNVTEVKVYLIPGKEKLRATATITLDNAFMVHGLKVIEGDTGLFVVMPAVKKNGVFKDIAHPITAEMRNQIVTAVLAEYARREEERLTQPEEEVYEQETEEE